MLSEEEDSDGLEKVDNSKEIEEIEEVEEMEKIEDTEEFETLEPKEEQSSSTLFQLEVEEETKHYDKEMIDNINEDIEEEIDQEINQKEEFEDLTKKQYHLFSSQEDKEDKEKIDIINKENTLKKEEDLELKKDNEVEKEIIETTDDRELKIWRIDFKEGVDTFNTALEVKYKSLKLEGLPIQFSNIPEDFTFTKEKSLGKTNIKIGDTTIHNCHLKIVTDGSLEILEIRNREFKLYLSVSLNNDTIMVSSILKSYEISSLIKTSRLLKVLELFNQIFSGTPISFKINRLYGDLVVKDEVELMRINTIQEFFKTLKEIDFKLDINTIPKKLNNYYLLELYAAFKEERLVETWCNFKLDNQNSKFKAGDSLRLYRTYEINDELSILEKIILKEPLEEKNIFKKQVVGYRKACNVEIVQINKK